MEKMRRSERLVMMTKQLMQNPQRVFSLTAFSEMFQAAKSSISEDLGIIKDAFLQMGVGEVETIAGAAGGVKLVPKLSENNLDQFLQELSVSLSEPERIVPGSFLYMNDIIYNPALVEQIGVAFATKFQALSPDYIVTVETKGIPLALMTAKAFNVPLVIARDAGKVSEGSSVSINYVSGSTKRIQTMALARRSLPQGSKVIIIDDFMKAGGTAKGLVELMHEFECQVLGFGVLISTAKPEAKLVQDYISLLELVEIDETSRKVVLIPSS